MGIPDQNLSHEDNNFRSWHIGPQGDICAQGVCLSGQGVISSILQIKQMQGQRLRSLCKGNYTRQQRLGENKQ